jgi:hypothetical protein
MKRTILTIAAAALIVGGCSGDKSNERTERPVKLGGGADEAAGEVAWTVPDGWVEETPSNAMRKAQFSLPAADGDSEDASVVITHFPGEGDVGGIDANIERWYGQMSQPDGKETSEVAEVSKDTVNGLEQTRVSMTGTYNGGMMMSGHGATEKTGYKMIATEVRSTSGPYFVKLVGPEATVNKWEASYDQFLASFQEG